MASDPHALLRSVERSYRELRVLKSTGSVTQRLTVVGSRNGLSAVEMYGFYEFNFNRDIPHCQFHFWESHDGQERGLTNEQPEKTPKFSITGTHGDLTISFSTGRSRKCGSLNEAAISTAGVSLGAVPLLFTLAAPELVSCHPGLTDFDCHNPQMEVLDDIIRLTVDDSSSQIRVDIRSKDKSLIKYSRKHSPFQGLALSAPDPISVGCGRPILLEEQFDFS